MSNDLNFQQDTDDTIKDAGVVIPSSPEDRKKLKEFVTSCTYCLQTIESEREAMKDIINAINEKFHIPKKLATKLARTMHKRNYDNLQQENEDFESLYELVIEGAKQQEQLDNTINAISSVE